MITSYNDVLEYAPSILNFATDHFKSKGISILTNTITSTAVATLIPVLDPLSPILTYTPSRQLVVSVSMDAILLTKNLITGQTSISDLQNISSAEVIEYVSDKAIEVGIGTAISKLITNTPLLQLNTAIKSHSTLRSEILIDLYNNNGFKEVVENVLHSKTFYSITEGSKLDAQMATQAFYECSDLYSNIAKEFTKVYTANLAIDKVISYLATNISCYLDNFFGPKMLFEA